MDLLCPVHGQFCSPSGGWFCQTHMVAPRKLQWKSLSNLKNFKTLGKTILTSDKSQFANLLVDRYEV